MTTQSGPVSCKGLDQAVLFTLRSNTRLAGLSPAHGWLLLPIPALLPFQHLAERTAGFTADQLVPGEFTQALPESGHPTRSGYI